MLKVIDVEESSCVGVYIGSKRKPWFEFWWDKDTWHKPSEWIFGVDRSCKDEHGNTQCIIIHAFLFGLTLLRGECAAWE